MIERYSRPDMTAVWTEDSKYQRWLEVELTVSDVLAERGIVPKEAVEVIRKKASFDVPGIQEIEREVKHDVIAFLTNVAGYIGPESRYVHYGMTSSDVLDTSLALQIKEAGVLLLEAMDAAIESLESQALAYKNVPMIGRTHGIHGEPTTFGVKMLVFHQELSRGKARLERALEEVVVGKIAGAVGTFAHLDPSIEEEVCRRLEIGFEPASTQIVQRDRHSAFVNALAIIASSLDKFSIEFRHLARTEVREVEEEFSKGQKGSSAMPHKRNPWRFENLSGLSRVMRGYAVAALENDALWHERDMSNSSVERVILPDATILLHFMLHRFAGLVKGLVVYPERMLNNLEFSNGLPFSATLLLEMTQKGISREVAYRLVQKHAMDTWDTGGSFKDRILGDSEFMDLMSKEEIERIFSLEENLRNIDAIFKRTLGK
ncbi:MAG: adenylosuccinate lyase [Deltaproteobacteria bacterium]|nr:adenylosuccinate lyase [Deltaproteobacteria bacterium]